MDKLIQLIEEVAKVPCFSSYEDRSFNLIRQLLKDTGCSIEEPPGNNLIITTEGKGNPIALTAHLDKINHFGSNSLAELPFSIQDDKIVGQLDDAVGVGICLYFAIQSQKGHLPPLIILLSEMEESFGLRLHPNLLKNNGSGLFPRIGATRISRYLKEKGIIPKLFLTVDTTPLFHGNHGIAVYSNHWDRNEIRPSPSLIEKTEALVSLIQAFYPEVLQANNTNDYLVYGELFNQGDLSSNGIPSIAIEPSIYPYHQVNEQVFIEDVLMTRDLIKYLLMQ
jgi:hypothetical protein